MQKTVACILLVILLGGSIVLALSSEARAAFIGWVREVHETYFAYHYSGKQQTMPETIIYCPTWVPDGYELEVKPEAKAYMIAVYGNIEGDRIFFNCSINDKLAILPIEQEDAQFSIVYVGDILADLYMDNTAGSTNLLVWEDEEQTLLFWIVSTLNAEDMIKIAESVSTIEK